MSNDDAYEVKSKLNIVDIVSEYVPLRQNGASYWGRCPFHNEKTPSFSVSSERQTFHCFGCGKGGDVFTFVMEMEHLEFREALERLAERAGVKLQRNSSYSGRKTSELRDIQIQARDFFTGCLRESGAEPARAYLRRRNLTDEACRHFEIGWAPSSWNALRNRLDSMGYTQAQILDSGLVSQGTKGLYDRFRGRIMFPIYDITDKLIGFGGRILEGDEAKYLNSPETQYFNKRNNLYLLNKAKISVREKKSIILVEGYMDAIRLHLFGFGNTVASLGTALTDAQAALIKRMAGLCYICYDSDAAGQEAALRGMYILQKHGVSVRVVCLTGGKDPDEILQQERGIEKFNKCLAGALPLPVYHASLCKHDMSVPEKANAAREDLLNGLASLSSFDVAPYLDTICQQLGVFPHELQRDIESRHEKIRGKSVNPLPEDDFNVDSEQNTQTANDLECIFCSLLWNNREIAKLFQPETVLPFIKDTALQNMISALFDGELPKELEDRWRQMGDITTLNNIAKGNGLADRENMQPDDAERVLSAIRRKYIEKRFSVLQKKLKQGTATEDEMKEHLGLSRMLKGGDF